MCSYSGSTQAGHLLYRLVGRTVFAQPDGIMCVDKDIADFHQHAAMRTALRAYSTKHQEGSAIRDKPAMQCNTVHNGGHAKFADAVVNIVTGRIFI